MHTSVASPSALMSSADLRALPLRDCHLRAQAEGGLARLVLEQRFENPHAEPLHVTYSLPLSHEAAVVAFSFRVGERTIEGQIDTKRRARERFEDAVASGHTAALLEEERSTVFTQELGNIPPRAGVVARVTIDMLLPYVALGGARGSSGQWELRFPLTVAPRYLGAEGRVPDAGRLRAPVEPVVGASPRASLSLSVRDVVPEGRSPESPSHALQCARAAGGAFEVSLGGEGRAPLDRDVVIRWDAAREEAHASAAAHACAEEDAVYALLSVVPPACLPESEAHPRDLTVLLDTSGSMDGAPLEHAKRFATALVASLGAKDMLHLVEFSNDARAFRPRAVPASEATKRDAIAWISGLRASGGTEMRTGILRALRDARPGRLPQVVLVTDGLIGFEREIVEAIFRDNACAARVHTVGVGSAVNRSLLAPAARAGRGLEIVCGLGEDVEPLVARLLARTNAPAVTELAVSRLAPSGEGPIACAVEKLPDLYAGAPVLVPVRLPRGGGLVVVKGKTARGEFRQEVGVAAEGDRPEVRALFGREAVADVEMRLAAGAYASARDADAEVERLGIAFGISTRMTSFVAVDRTDRADPTRPTRREAMPQALPFGMSAEGAGLRAPTGERRYEGGKRESHVDALRAEARAGRGAPPAVLMRAPAPAGAPPAGAPAPAGAPPAFSRSPAPSAPSPDAGPPPALPRSSEATKEQERVGGAVPPAGPRDLPSEEAPRQAGLLERAARLLFGSAKKGSAAAPGGSAQRVAGRIRVLSEGLFVVDLQLDAELGWELWAAVLVLASGARVAVAVDPTRSTAPGTYRAGMVLRLTALAMDVGPDVLRGALALELARPDWPLVVTFE